MYICLCNPFTDKDVKTALEDTSTGRKTPGKVYKACSGGQKPCCGTCICMLKDMVANHNAAAGEPDILAAE